MKRPKPDTGIISQREALARAEKLAKPNGKGDKPRPSNREEFNRNYDQINWKKKPNDHHLQVPH